MSAQFIIEYGGCPVRIGLGAAVVVSEWQADRHTSESDAWLAAHHAGLNPDRCKVVNLYERHQIRSAMDSRPQTQSQTILCKK